ncbi:Hypothetical predicted protein [Mytilus galloprovincialis]|uniref:Uncharacterized protein n=1 Tax=Mytilus galloprovincialis TaxID=29158 RepID=A0A8B6GET3_MYTGA|nr:Hypothetical predicted protein [Mytilus galloprovincialis]
MVQWLQKRRWKLVQWLQKTEKVKVLRKDYMTASQTTDGRHSQARENILKIIQYHPETITRILDNLDNNAVPGLETSKRKEE